MPPAEGILQQLFCSNWCQQWISDLVIWRIEYQMSLHDISPHLITYIYLQGSSCGWSLGQDEYFSQSISQFRYLLITHLFNFFSCIGMYGSYSKPSISFPQLGGKSPSVDSASCCTTWRMIATSIMLCHYKKMMIAQFLMRAMYVFSFDSLSYVKTVHKVQE